MKILRFNEEYDNWNWRYSDTWKYMKCSYWRFKINIDCILKVDISSIYDKNPHNFTTLNLETGDFENDVLDGDTMEIMAEMAKKGAMLRPATDEEIEQFELAINTNKYNL